MPKRSTALVRRRRRRRMAGGSFSSFFRKVGNFLNKSVVSPLRKTKIISRVGRIVSPFLGPKANAAFGVANTLGFGRKKRGGALRLAGSSRSYRKYGRGAKLAGSGTSLAGGCNKCKKKKRKSPRKK